VRDMSWMDGWLHAYAETCSTLFTSALTGACTPDLWRLAQPGMASCIGRFQAGEKPCRHSGR
jgi:hypothetical protein